jgi:hypothetical protein
MLIEITEIIEITITEITEITITDQPIKTWVTVRLKGRISIGIRSTCISRVIIEEALMVTTLIGTTTRVIGVTRIGVMAIGTRITKAGILIIKGIIKEVLITKATGTVIIQVGGLTIQEEEEVRIIEEDRIIEVT